MMKKYISYITAVFTATVLCGCAAFNEWFSSVDWNNINNVVIPVVQSTAKTTVYLVCEKNEDLKPIFIAAGNGLLLAVADDKFTPEQIQKYITDALGDENEQYNTIVLAGLQTLIDGYKVFYNTNWKTDDNPDTQATIESVFRKYLSALATGVIDGAKLSQAQFKQLANTNTVTFKEVNTMQVIK